jgi:phage shock protein C
MTTISAGADRRLVRDRDHAVLGGVCAGLASYLGFNLKVTRILAVVAFLVAMPFTLIAYFAAVFLIPSESSYDYDVVVTKRSKRGRRRKTKRDRHSEDMAPERQSTIAADISRRCESMDERLARLERHVTSRRFQIDQELSRL